MRTKYVLLLAALIAIACATAVRAEIPIVQADTVFQGFGGGSVSGIVVGPTGETVIVMHDAQPVEINIKTKQIVREFEKVPNAIGTGNSPIMIKSKNYFTAYVTSTELLGIKGFDGNVIWDYSTGKIVKALQDVFLLSDGSKFYSRCYSDNYTKEYIGQYDINTFKFIDSIYFDNPKVQGTQVRSLQCFNILPNSNKVIIGVNNKYSDGSSKRSTLYELNFETKQYTEIPIQFEAEQTSTFIDDIKMSETGKYFVVMMGAYLIYDKEYKFLFKETVKHLQDISGDPDKHLVYWIPNFIHDDYLLSFAETWSVANKNYGYYNDFYGLNEKMIKKRILLDFSSDMAILNNDIAILFKSGKVAHLKLDALPVEEITKTNSEKTAEFQNGKLLISSEISGFTEINILDYKGNILYSKKELFLTTGKNSIAIDFPLSNGVYFAVIKTEKREYSYKFLVSR